jgi:hypothetical protein
MSRLRSNSILEGPLAADLFRNTLSRIPTAFGRLAYLASLRDPDSGVYVHQGLMSIYGDKKSRQALAQRHREIFRDWLNLPLVEKTEDLRSYVNTLDDPAAFLESWTPGLPSRNYLPEAARGAEKRLFLDEFEILLEILKGQCHNAAGFST